MFLTVTFSQKSFLPFSGQMIAQQWVRLEGKKVGSSGPILLVQKLKRKAKFHGLGNGSHEQITVLCKLRRRLS